MDQLELLYTILRDNHTISYNAFAATSLLLYEMIITSGQEITLIWRSSWSPVNVLYLLIRYYSLVYLFMYTFVSINTNLSTKFCGPSGVFQDWGLVALLPAVDIIVLLRIYALFHQSIKIGVLLVVLWLAETISLLTVFGLGFNPSSDVVMANPLPGILPGCFPVSPPLLKQVLLSGAIATAFQATYFGLTLYRMFQQIKPHGLMLSPILKIFFRDGAAYCLAILVMYLVNTLLVRYLSGGPLQGLGLVWVVAVFAITSSRLVLNIKGSVASPGYDTGDVMELEESSRGQTEVGQLTSIFDITLEGVGYGGHDTGHDVVV